LRGKCLSGKPQQVRPVGADLDDDQLHDDLQFSGGELPNSLCRAGHGADRRGDHDQ
jgi:hypothetical protein